MSAADWIKMRNSLGTDPDVIAISAKIGIDEFGVIGRLHAIWCWLDQHSEDGMNVPISTDFLDKLTSRSGFSDALRSVGWLAGRSGSLSFPGYLNHNGTTAKARASGSKRQERFRKKSRDSNEPSVTGVTVEPSLEKIREDKSTTPTPSGQEEAAAETGFPEEPENPEASEPTRPATKVLPNGWQKLTSKQQGIRKVLCNNRLMERIGKFFNRRSTTLWTIAEAATLAELAPDRDSVELMESYYLAKIVEPDKDHRRKDLITLLNHWNGELDRANSWKFSKQ